MSFGLASDRLCRPLNTLYMRSSRPVVTDVLVFTLEVSLTDICLNKDCMIVWTMSCTEMFL